MKIKYLSIYELSVYMITMLLIFQINLYTLLFSVLLSFISFLIYLTQKNKSLIDAKWVYFYIFFEILFFLLQIMRNNNFSFEGLKHSFLFYGYVFLLVSIFPLYEILKNNYQKFLKKLNLIGFLALIIRATIWFIYNFLHHDFLFYQIGGGRLDWVRSIHGIALSRSNGLFLDGFLFAYSISQILSNSFQKNRRNTFFYFESFFLFFFCIVVYQSRAQLIYYIITLLVGLVYINTKKRNKAINFLITCTLVFLIAYLFKDKIASFVNSFSVYSENGGSTSARLLEYQYFSQLWKDINPLLGFGYLNTEDIFYAGYRLYLTDLGIIAQLFQNGVLGFLICILPFVIGLIVALKAFVKKYSFYNNIIILLITYLVASSSNFNPYVFVYFPIIPLFIAMIMKTE